MHTHMNALTLKYLCINVPMYLHTYAPKHALACMHACMHACTHTHTHRQTKTERQRDAQRHVHISKET